MKASKPLRKSIEEHRRDGYEIFLLESEFSIPSFNKKFSTFLNLTLLSKNFMTKMPVLMQDKGLLLLPSTSRYKEKEEFFFKLVVNSIDPMKSNGFRKTVIFVNEELLLRKTP